MTILATRLNGVSESATLRLNAMVQSLKAQGADIINLTAGEPDFSVREPIKRAAIEAIEKNQSKYTPVAGIQELRNLIAEKTNRQQAALGASQRWKGANVVVSNGGKQALFNTCLALLNPGDEALIPAPYWLSYPEMVKIASAHPKIVITRREDRFKLTPKGLAESITPRTRMLFLNSPSNPTGVMYTREELQALGAVLQSHPYGKQVWVVSDEIYDRIELGQIPFCSFLDACPSLQSQTITINGMSKSCAMTGWRIGWSVAPLEVTAGIATLQGQSTSGINAPAQWASIAALKLGEKDFEEEVSSYRRRAGLALEILSKGPKIDILSPDGAFYIFFGVQKCLRPGEDSLGFAERLLQEAQVAVVPGTPFGAPEYVRISFATDDAQLQKGCQRIVQAL
jgi:aspartate aminotransferase